VLGPKNEILDIESLELQIPGSARKPYSPHTFRILEATHSSTTGLLAGCASLAEAA